MLDNKSEVLVCVVAAQYSFPEWPAFQLLNDLLASVQQCADDTMTLPEGALDERLRPVMQELVVKYSQTTITTCALEVKEESVHPSRESALAARKRLHAFIAVAVPLVFLVLFYVVFAPRSAPVEEADSAQATTMLAASSRHQAGLQAVRSMITLI